MDSFLIEVRKRIAVLCVSLNDGTYTLLQNAFLFILAICSIAIVQHGQIIKPCPCACVHVSVCRGPIS